MTKYEFLSALESRLSGLPAEDRRRSLEYYGEMIDDRMEDGLAEEEAINAVGGLDAIAAEILSDASLTRAVTEQVHSKRIMRPWEIVLLVLGSPLWLSLALALAAVLLSVYITLWSVVISFYAVTLSVGIGSAAGILGLFLLAAKGRLAGAVLMLGAGLVCAGLAILLYYLSNLTAKAVVILSRGILTGLKRLFTGKEAA